MDEQRKTRIGPIKAGEIIIAKPIREDLQDKYENLRDLADAHKVAISESEHHMQTNGCVPPPDLLKKIHLSSYAHQKACIDFWWQVREIYNVWHCDIGIRDGYVLVREPGMSFEGPGFRIMKI